MPSASTVHMKRRKATVTLSAAQAAAILSALDCFLAAGTAEECHQVFGTAAGTAAARPRRAADRVSTGRGRNA